MILALLARSWPVAPRRRDCPVHFTDVAALVGPRLHPRPRRARPSTGSPETMGSGLAWLDYDNDGWMDLYVVQCGPLPAGGQPAAQDRLFRNDGDGTFTDVTAKAGLKDTAYGMGAIRRRLRQRRLRRPLRHELRRQHPLPQQRRRNLHATSRRRPGARGPAWARAPPGPTSTATGGSISSSRATSTTETRQDLFCGDPVTGARDYCPPDHVSRHGQRRSTATTATAPFADVTKRGRPRRLVGKGLGVVFVDVDLDGKPDIYVANDEVMNFLFRNLGGGRFEDISVVSGAGFDPQGNPQGGMGVDAGDLDGDGLPDLVVANFENETNEYYRNLGSGVFEDLSVSSGLRAARRCNFVRLRPEPPRRRERRRPRRLHRQRPRLRAGPRGRARRTRNARS